MSFRPLSIVPPDLLSLNVTEAVDIAEATAGGGILPVLSPYLSKSVGLRMELVDTE